MAFRGLRHAYGNESAALKEGVTTRLCGLFLGSAPLAGLARSESGPKQWLSEVATAPGKPAPAQSGLRCTTRYRWR